MCDNTLIDDHYPRLDDYIDSLPYKKENLIGILHHAQGLFGYLPDKLQWHIAQKLDIPSAKVYGVVSFYSFFTMKPRGKHVINICMGTACFVRGAEKLQAELEKQLGIKTGETTQDNLFSLDSLRCIGACGLAPVMMIDGKVYGRLHDPEEIKRVLDGYRPSSMHEARGTMYDA
ncbi:NAD(P)H-dependent oxidoreductase subunit E [Desulfosporosinus sp. BICA1-9]|uniref:NADH-quinone oxidoreductase subunit NuoE family protein n=1 Tax=Desulfosporosinus sp. BICA1-9 TaxID=1531958 RepID=UPI00054C02A6|nr:NAD(P)H-dependent oxidoreductase subunit E [Desulfosporosinus sp. BICA1-9]KJS46514.1 MAG: NADH dehydrogenase [Peptococcaceae bacterium BRH_c23]KJS78863.1 MAG: NADH dehydrogenase [Desulfosporosinus sp. BICA1-9]HBW38873.1 NAD(P)H-dependent oxidoreductase subunit E [Desulfosporosinus sp.]